MYWILRMIRIVKYVTRVVYCGLFLFIISLLRPHLDFALQLELENIQNLDVEKYSKFGLVEIFLNLYNIIALDYFFTYIDQIPLI